MPTVADLALELERCAYCNARPGVWCRRYAQHDPEHRGTPTGRASYLHAARTRRLREFTREAYAEAETAGINNLEWRLVSILKRVAPTQLYAAHDLIEWIQGRAQATRGRV